MSTALATELAKRFGKLKLYKVTEELTITEAELADTIDTWLYGSKSKYLKPNERKVT